MICQNARELTVYEYLNASICRAPLGIGIIRQWFGVSIAKDTDAIAVQIIIGKKEVCYGCSPCGRQIPI